MCECECWRGWALEEEGLGKIGCLRDIEDRCWGVGGDVEVWEADVDGGLTPYTGFICEVP